MEPNRVKNTCINNNNNIAFQIQRKRSRRNTMTPINRKASIVGCKIPKITQHESVNDLDSKNIFLGMMKEG